MIAGGHNHHRQNGKIPIIDDVKKLQDIHETSNLISK